MNRQGRMEKRNKTLDTGRCENIDALYVNTNNNNNNYYYYCF